MVIDPKEKDDTLVLLELIAAAAKAVNDLTLAIKKEKARRLKVEAALFEMDERLKTLEERSVLRVIKGGKK